MSDFTEAAGPLAPKDLNPFRPYPTPPDCAYVIGPGSLPQPPDENAYPFLT